jgi:N-methylhydantoinase A/oxoprolinase/acetone carboxylase beta subunit
MMTYYIGVDVGSLSTDVVVIDEAANVLGSAITLTGANSTQAAETALAAATQSRDKNRSGRLRGQHGIRAFSGTLCPKGGDRNNVPRHGRKTPFSPMPDHH